MKTLDQKIETLKPGQQATLSECNGIKVIAERSGDGKTLRFIRETQSGLLFSKQPAFRFDLQFKMNLG